MKYFYYVRNKRFTQALAVLKPKWRYVTAKRRWYASRLGLYRTVLENLAWFPAKTPRHTVVSVIAAIKRQKFTDDTDIRHIEHILYHKRYRQFHQEFVKEIISLYPEVIFNFLNKNSDDLDSSYYKGLYITLKHKYGLSNLRFDSHSLQKSTNDYTDYMCLYSNATINRDFSKISLDKLANLNQIFAHHQLNQIMLSDERKSFTVTNLKVIEQINNNQNPQYNSKLPKVTVVVTTYDSSETIESCIHSLLQQTWSNLEIIIVDDASTDDTLLCLQRFSNHIADIKVIALPQNVGTFAAKSIGAQYATGEFLTCQDSDDWAHPQKIAEQVQPLIEDISIIATTSYWLRLDHSGQYYVRQIYPFMRQNPASPMFRLQTVKQEAGLWHIVRTGADSEFSERLKVVFGSERVIVVKKPLTIASHRPNSLMTSEQFGIYNQTAALARLDYWEAWRLWHIDTLYQKASLLMPSIQQQASRPQAVFSGIPDSIKVDMLNLKESLARHMILNKF